MKNRDQYIKFIDMIKSINIGRHSIKEIAAYLLFLDYCSASEDRHNKYAGLSVFDAQFYMEHPELVELKEYISSLNLSDEDIKEWIRCIDDEIVYENGNVNVTSDFLKLVCKVLDLKPNDILYEIGTLDEKFLYQSYKYIDSLGKNILRLRTIFKAENDFTSYMAEIFYILNDMNYSRVVKEDIVKNLNITKIYINPVLTANRNLGFKKESINQWHEMLKAVKNLKTGQKIVAAVPDNMLSRNQDMKYRKELLESKNIEGLISIPLRLFSSNTNVSVTLIVLSKNNKKIKVFDGRIFDLDDIRSAGLENISNLIFERYNDSECKEVDYIDLIVRGNVLSVSNMVTEDVYENVSSLRRLSDVAEIFKGYKGTAANFRDEMTDSEHSNYYVLTSSDIDNGIINYDSMMKIIDGKKYEKYFLQEGDLVLTTKSTKVKIAVVNELKNKKVIASGSMMIVRPNFKAINSTYLKMFFESAKGRSILGTIQKGTVITTMTLDDFKGLQVPCPSINKQIEQVYLYKELQSQYESKKKELDALQEKINNVFDVLN